MRRRLSRHLEIALIIWSLLAGTALAQTPSQHAWQILEAAASSSKTEIRADNARALGLVDSPKAVELLESALDDKDADVRSAAATSLGMIKSKRSIPKLIERGKKEADGDVIMAIAKALTDMGDPKGYEVFYAVVTGERKSGEGLIASQGKMLTEALKSPKSMAGMAFQQGMGFVPFGGVALGAFEAILNSGKNEALVKAAAIRALAKDPDPRSGTALLTATKDKEWIVRAAAFDALARRGDASLVPDMVNGLGDGADVVRLTAAAAIAKLGTGGNPHGK